MLRSRARINATVLKRQSPGVERSKVTPYYNIGSLSITQPRELSRFKKIAFIFARLLSEKLIYCLILSLVVFLQGCSISNTHQTRQADFQKWIENNGKIKVLATTAIIDDLVKQIGGDYVDSTSLIQGQLDPHSYQLVKGDDEKLSFAQVIFYNGLGLEHGPSLYTYLHKHPKAISLGDELARQDSDSVIYVHGQKDPHIWMDISLWSKNIPFIVRVLSQLDPDHADVFQANGQKVKTEMMAVHQRVREIMHEVPSDLRFLVTSHDAFNYFSRAYLSENGEVESGEWEKRFVAPEGLAPESQLSVTDIQAIINHLLRYKIQILFPESNVSRDSIKKIVQAGNEEGLMLKIACCPLYADAMGPPGSDGDTYLKMILYNAQTLAAHMDGRAEIKSSDEKISNE